MIPSGKSAIRLARILVATLGACAIAWSIFAIQTCRVEAAFAHPALRILGGDRFSPEQLSALTQHIDSAPTALLRPAALIDIAIIRLRLAEVAVQSGNTQLAASAFDSLQTAVGAALEHTPTSSFMWLTDYWVHSTRQGKPASDLQSLDMSYMEGPNEGWIALRRNPVALGAFASLPSDLVDPVLNEFTGLVASGFYSDAANILAGPGWAVRDKLLNATSRINIESRRRFAKALSAKDLQVTVPGVN